MPTYTYRCLQCQLTFDCVQHIDEHASAHPRCPNCGSGKVRAILAPCFVKTARKS